MFRPALTGHLAKVVKLPSEVRYEGCRGEIISNAAIVHMFFTVSEVFRVGRCKFEPP